MKKIKKINGNPKKIQKERKSTGRNPDLLFPPQVLFFEEEYPTVINYRLYKEKITKGKRTK